MPTKTTVTPTNDERRTRIAAEIAELEAEIERVYERSAPLKGVPRPRRATGRTTRRS